MQPTTLREQPVIMLIDDDRPIVDLLTEILQEEGYRTIECLRASDAHRNIRQAKPNLVILDLHLGGAESGLSVLDILRLTPATAKIPVIICSADSNLLKEQEYQLRLGNCEILEKPFDVDELLNKVQRMVDRPRPARRHNLPATATSSTLRASRRITEQERTDADVTTNPPMVTPRIAPASLETISPLGVQEDDVQTVLYHSQQIGHRAQLLATEAHQLRSMMTSHIHDLAQTASQVDYIAWFVAMAGPQPRWLWRGRTSYEEPFT